MKSILRLIVPLLVLVAVFSTSAYADSFTFSYTGSGITASGILQTDSLVSGSYLITGLTGTRNGSAMTLLAPNAFAANDNLIFQSEPRLDFAGFSYVAGGTNYNVYYNTPPCCNGAVDYYETTVSGNLGQQIRFSMSAVPEASSLALLASGLGLIGFVGVMRFRKTLRSESRRSATSATTG
jgi:hypothetical protein